MLLIHSASTAPLKRVAIFVDVQNVYYTTRQAYAAHFDYNAFWRQVTADRQVVKAVAFAIDRGDEKQRQFQAILRGIGMEVKLKPFISRADGSAKGDWDVGITLEVMDCAANTDIVVLVSGDGDFDLLAQRLRDRHALDVEVYGVAQLTADSLKRAATRFIPIDERFLLTRDQ
jgi:uncharacterized LabA/DUF88 family protein